MTRAKILNISALALGIVLIFVWNLRHYRQPSSPLPEQADLISVLPGATRFEPHLEPVDYYQGFFPDGRPAGVAFVTSRIPPRIAGFTSEISILVGMTPAGSISRLEVLHHQETPSYFRMVLDSGLLPSFLGVDLKSGFPELDAVSGATISSQAIIQDLETSARAVAEKVYGYKVPDSSISPKRKFPYLEPFLVILLFLSIPVSRRLSRFRWARFLPFILGFFIIGLYLDSPLSLNHIVNLLSLHPPAFYAQPGLFLLLLLALVSSFFFGNIYCSSLCPFGAVLELGTRLFPKRIRVAPGDIKKASALRSLLLFLVIAGIFGCGLNILAQLEPYPYLFAPAKSSLLWLYITLTILFSLVFRRFWCRIFCPTGAFLDLLARPGKKLEARSRKPGDDKNTINPSESNPVQGG
ncbi:MAG: 4Fe-4S binding protein [bacterium]|nr:4Fe-4S binding protein [bacterium]